MSRALVFLLALGCGAAAAHEPAPLPAGLSFGGPFELVDHGGRVRRPSDFAGRHLLVTFGYTACPDICGLGLAVMSAALDELGEGAQRLQPIFITVDPARDTPDRLAAYVKSVDPRLVGLTGSESRIAAVARAYRVHRLKVLPDPQAPADYLVDHGSLVYLMAPDGRFLTIFPHGTGPARMAEVLRTYLH